MRFVTLSRAAALAAAIGGSLLIPSFSGAVNTISPVSAEALGDTTGLPEEVISRRLARENDWVTSASLIVSRSQEVWNAEDAFAHLSLGVTHKLVGRDLTAEYLDALEDAELESVFRFGRDEVTRDHPSARARLKIATEVLSRESLSAKHSEAAYDKGLMTYVTTSDEGAIQSAFEGAAQFKGNFASKSSAAAGVFDGIETPGEFEQARTLYDLAEFYPIRLQGTRIVNRVLARLETVGIQGLDPSENESSQEPLIAVSMAAFDFGKLTLLSEIDEAIGGFEGVQPATNEYFLYYFALAETSHGSLESAQDLFLRLMALETGSKISADASVRLGEAYVLNREYFEAAVQFMDSIETTEAYPTIQLRAQKCLAVLVETGKVDEGEVQLALRAGKRSRQTAMTKHSR